MTSMTTSQQTDRSGADEIPGPRGGQGVRLLVLGADPDAQDLRDQAQAAGYELAQRYSARVSHVAYGPGIDPEDARYAKIRDSGLALLPLQKCAEALGLRADEADTAVDAADVADPVDVAEVAEAAYVAVADVARTADAVDVAEATEVADVVVADVASTVDPADSVDVVDVAEATAAAGVAVADVASTADAADVTAADAADLAEAVEVELGAAIEPELDPEPERVSEVETEVEAAVVAEPEVEAQAGSEIDDEPLAFPPLHTASGDDPDDKPDEQPTESTEPEAHEQSTDIEDAEALERLYDHEVENAFVPGFAAEPVDLDVPLAAAVLGADPWEGDSEQASPEEPVHQPTSDADSVPASAPRPEASDSDSGFGRVLLSLLWALIPLATFGLLTPVTFGYAAYRLRSRGLALTALAYTIAVVVSFALSAMRPHSVSPADTTGALLTVCLAGTWIGGTLHALSLRTRVFAR